MDYTKLAQQFGGSVATLPKSGGVDYSALASKFGAIPTTKAPEQNSSGLTKYDVAPAPIPMLTKESTAEKIARLNKESAEMTKKAKQANSFGGLFKETLKGAGKIIASSEIGLGETIGKIGSSKNLDVYTKNVDVLTKSNITLQKLIKEKEARGQDASSLKRSYNSNVDMIQENRKNIDEYGDSLPTDNQALGQIGGTGLDVLTAGTYGKAATGMKTGKLAKTASVAKTAATVVAPEVAKVAKIASKPAGIFTKKGITNVVKGAAVGYGVDVTEGLQGHRGEDRKDGKAFIPGFGTAFGAAIPAVTETAQSFKNRKIVNPETGMNPKQTKVVDKYIREIDKIESGYKSMKKIQDNPKRIQAKKNLAKSGLLNGSINSDGKIDVRQKGGALEQFNQFISPFEDNVTKIVKNEGVDITKDQALKKLTQNIESSNISGKDRIIALNNIKKEVAGLRLNKNGKIDLSEIQKTKIYKGENINYFDPVVKKYDKTVVRSLKELIEEYSENPHIKKINADLSELYDVKNLIVALDGKIVKGGRLGKYFSKIVGAVAGGSVGGLPGGILGSEISAKIYGKNLSSKFKGKTGFALQPTEMMQLAEKNANTLKIKTKHLPSEYTNELPTIPFGQKGVSKLEAGSKGLPIAEGSPNVYLPKVSSSQSNKLGTLDKSVSLKKTQTTPKIIAPKNPKPNINSSIPQSKGKVNIIKKKSLLQTIKDIPNKQGGFVAIPGSNTNKLSKEVEKKATQFMKDWTDTNAFKGSDSSLKKMSSKQIDELAEYFKKVSIPEEKPPKFITLYRGVEKGQKEGLLNRPTSWTRLKEVAEEHTYGNGKVIKIKVPADQVLLDVNALPHEMSTKYGFIPDEEEIILKAKKEGFFDKLKNTPNKQGGFIKIGGKEIKAIDVGTRKEMESVIDYVRLKKPYSQKMEEIAGILGEKYNISSKNLTGLTNKFEEILKNTKSFNFN